jgi:polysaccharide export outer membrane protein
MKHTHIWKEKVKMKKALICLLIVLALPACSLAQDYVIGGGDKLKISVWGEEGLSGEVTVRPDGKITLPAVGDVAAAGLTPAELTKGLTEKLKPFVKTPIVTISVNTITNNKVYVFGGGVASGEYNLDGKTTLLRLMTKLGDLKDADLTRAYIIRGGEKLEVDFYDLFRRGNISKDAEVMADDMIFIPDNTRTKIYVVGEVKDPKYINYKEGLKILDAIIDAGWFTDYAKENKVLILRQTSDKLVEIKVKIKDLTKDGDLTQNVDLQPGDFVIVKETIF